MTSRSGILAFGITAFTLASPVFAQADETRQLLRSVNNLGDPSGYCLDIPGFGPRMRKDAPINTHTCKYNRPGFSVDEEFSFTETRQLRLPEYDLCLSAESLAADANVFTIACDDDRAHAWVVAEDGRVSPLGSEQWCLTLSSDLRYVNTSPGNITPNSSRGVAMQACDEPLSDYQQWRFSGPAELDTVTANTLRAGMSPAIADGIRELGYNVRVPQTAALYENEARMFGPENVVVSESIAYGPEAGQQLQVYHGVNRNNPRDQAPVVLFVHGGGFVRGNLEGLADVATHFAALGFVSVNMTYPLAPEADWPSGPRSVASAVRWIKSNATDLKIDPDNVFVFGNSAGGTNVAEFVFRPDLQDGDRPLVAGAILASPGVKVDPNRADAAEHPYYGDMREDWQQKQLLGNIDDTSIPVLVFAAEFDPKGLQTGVFELINELAVERGTPVRYRQLRGHNHTSYLESIGTRDTRMSAEIVDFLLTAGRDN